MEQIPVTAKKPRPKAWDSALLVGASLLVAAAGVGAFLVFDDHPEYVFAVCSGAVFIAAVGPSFRKKLGSPAVWVFLTVWLVLHVVIYLLTLAYFGLLFYVPIALLELWMFYAFALARFGKLELDRP